MELIFYYILIHKRAYQIQPSYINFSCFRFMSNLTTKTYIHTYSLRKGRGIPIAEVIKSET